MNKRDNKNESNRHFKVSHQNLCITNINFQKQSFIGFVELHIISQRDELKKIKLNSKQCRIYRVMINEQNDCTFTYSDPTLEISQSDSKQRNLDNFYNCHLSVVNSVDPDRGNGELIVQVPQTPEIISSIKERKIMRIHVEFTVEKPLGGVQFVVPEAEGSLAERGAHMFTYRYENSSRLWFPCVDSYSEPCTWRMEFTVDANMVAVSCGDLIETVFTQDMKKKTFHYCLSTPTSAPNIALAVGPFEIMVDPFMHEVTHFCLPHLLPLLRDTCSFLHEAFEFYEELLSSRYPYSCYKQVFVDEAYENAQPFATMTILSTNLLHSRHIIDQTYISRCTLSRAIAEQFFGCFITMQSWSDAWLTRGISAFLASQYFKKAFGNNEYRFELYKQLQDVIEYEQKYREVILDPSNQTSNDTNSFYFPIKHLHTISPLYDKAHKKKSHLVIRMLENYLGRELLLQVFNKLLSLAINAAPQKFSANVWFNFLVSTNSFIWAISTVTGKNIDTFLKQWVYQGGHAKFHGSFVFNRKRNTVELEIKQLETTSTGIKRYVGPLVVTVQELDGTFKHPVQIEDNVTKHDLTCHSKSRRNKKKKIPLCTGEEVDMDLSAMDPDSPVLWIRIDPEMQLLRQVVFEQPDYQWQYQLRYERDVTAQMEVIECIDKYSTPPTRNALTDTINNEQCFYRVRCAATMCLRKVANQMAATWTGPPAMLTIFRKLFGSYSCPHIIKLNNFSKFQHYFLQKAIPLAMAGLRNTHGICPQEVLRFLFDLFKYNDNSKNKFSDNYYRAILVDALAETVTPVVSAVIDPTGLQITADALSTDTKCILEEITRYLNLDKILPCYKLTVTVSCLKAIRHLQKMGHLPSNPLFFREYAVNGVFINVRKAALEALIDITKSEVRKEDLDFLLDLVENEPIPSIRLFILKKLVKNPPFVKNQQNLLNTEDLVDRLWRLMNSLLSYDSKIRCAVVDLYYKLYGRGRPSCLPKPEFSVVLNLKEKKATVSTSLVTDEVSNHESKMEVEDEINHSKEDSKQVENLNDIEMMPTEYSFDDMINDSKHNQLSDQSSGNIMESEILAQSPTMTNADNTRSLLDDNITASTSQAQSSIDLTPDLIVRQLSPSPIPILNMEQPISHPKEKDREKSKKDKDESGHSSKVHKDKKKKKKKHKHKSKHKHKHHSDKEKHSHDRTASSGGSTNPSPVKHSQRSMDVSGDDPDLARTVLTCEGDLRDPTFPNRLRQIICKLKRLVSDDHKKPFQVTKVEPWNSVRVTFNIPRNAAQRLRQLAERGDNTLRELGILSVQIEGDQVITLTLANNFNESHEQLLVGKANESVVNSASVVTSTVNSSAININNNDIALTYNHVNNNSLISTSNSVSSVVSSSIDFIGSPSSGPSVEITRKNIAQYLSQQHVDVVTSNSNSVLSTSESNRDRLTFISPNVVAPANQEPIPFLNSSASSTLTSQSPTGVGSNASTCNVSSSGGSRVSSQVTAIGNASLREVQSNYGLFPFASMQHAMHTKQGLNTASHYTSVQRPNQVITTPSVRLPLTSFGQTQASQSLPNNAITSPNSTITSITASVSNISSISKPQSTYIRDAKSVRVGQQSLPSQPQQSPQTQAQSQPAQTMALAAVAAAVNQSCINANGASANVALTSPLLVNLLQSDAAAGHLKVMAPPTSSSLNQVNPSSDSGQKRKPRKARKSKDKTESEIPESTHSNNSNPVTQSSPLSCAQSSVSITPTTSATLKHIPSPSNSLPQQSGIDSASSIQTQSSFNLPQHLISIPISAISRFPSIHPEAQGQPQVVRAGHLSLRSQLSRSQVSAAIVGSPPIASAVRKPLYVTTTQASCSKSFQSANAQTKPHEEKSSLIVSTVAANEKVVGSTNEKDVETNPVFPSPPASRMNSKTKHLINPFTGLLEPMLSDEEEEDRPSPATLFPELDAGSDVGGHSERSLSDTGSNGKDNNHSSDTDSGLGKSGTDVSSQSSMDVANGDTPTHTNEISSSTCVAANDGTSANSSAADKLKLRVKMESPKQDSFPSTSSSNSSFHPRSHFTKQKSNEPSNPSSSVANQCLESQVLIAEPRVPPLHISIRGPNSAVVVSNRRDSTSELEIKATSNVSKKVRGVRTTRAMSAESTLVTECTNNLNKNQRKKLQREQRFLSGGGIVTSNLSLCASPSVESLVDFNKTINDSSFALSSTNSAETVETVFLQSSEVCSNSAQNKLNDNNNDNNISTNKSVPQINNDDISSEQCAIHVTSNDNVSKTSELSKDDNIENRESRDLNSVNTSIPTPNSASVSLGSVIPEDSDSNIDKTETKCAVKPSSHLNQKIQLNVQTCHTNNETTHSEQTHSENEVSIPETEQKGKISLKDTTESSESLRSKPRKLAVAAVVTVEPLINANTEAIVSKISRIGRLNCIPSAIPALVTSRELNSSARTTNLFHLNKANSPVDENAIEDECDNEISLSETTSTVPKLNLNMSENVNKLCDSVTLTESEPMTCISVNSHSQQTTPNLLNGDVKCETPNSLTISNESNSLETDSNSNQHDFNDLCQTSSSTSVKNEDQNMELNNIECHSESAKIDIQPEVHKIEETNENNTDSKANQMPINTSNLSTTEITATSNSSVQAESEANKNLSSEVDKPSVENHVFDHDLKTSNRSVVEEDIVAKSNEDDNKANKSNENDEKSDESEKVISQASSQSEPRIVGTSDETAKQPLQIVITTTVPSFTTNTSTSMFPQLKPSTLESGSRVTLITFKPNLNSPNTSTNNSGKTSDLTNPTLTNAMPPKAVPFKLLTIPSGSGGITVRSAANKLVELINSTASSPVSPLSPNTLPSSGSPIPINTTSPPVRLLVSKVATAGNVTQTGVPVSVAGNSIGQLVVVKSVVVTNPSPSIKLVPAKSPSINSPSLLIPMTRTNSPIESFNSVNTNNEQKPKETPNSSLGNDLNNSPTIDESSNSESDVQNQDSNSTDVDLPQLEPVDLTVQCQDSQSLSSNDDTKLEDIECESVPRLIRSSIENENQIHSDEEIIDDKLHSVASDHNYIMKKSSDGEDIDEALLNLSGTSENLDSSKDNDILKSDDEDCSPKMPDLQPENSLQLESKQSSDIQSRPNKRKSSENAAELIKACMGVEDSPKKNSFSYSPSFPISTGVVARIQNVSTRTRASSLDNDCVTNESSEANFSNRSKGLRIRKGKVSSEPPYTPETVCSSDDEMTIKDTSGISWGNKPRLRAGTVPKNQKINKQKNVNCKDSNKDKIANRSNEKGKKGRDRDQIGRASSTQRSTRRSRDQNIMISTGGINLHTSESSSEPLHMEIVGLELSNDSSTNNYSCDPSTASTTSPIITSSLLVKRKARVSLNNSEQSDGVVTKRRRIVKETHR